MKFVPALLLGAILLYSGRPSAAQSAEIYKTRLSPLPADVRTRAELAGIGSATATLAGTKLSITGTFEGLLSNAVSAKLHNGTVAGVRGAPFADLTISKSTQGTLSGSADLTPEQLQHLKKGGLYIQIYAEKPADGTLWGWLQR